MPLKRFFCPDNEQIECAKCLAENGCRMASRCCARPVLKLMYEGQREWKGIPSTTQLMRGTMEAFLSIIHDYAASPDKMAFMLHGTGTHKMLEDHGDDISKAELDYSDEQGSVRPDLIESEGGKNILIDYKTSSSFAVAKALGIYMEDTPVLDPVTQKPLFFKSGAKKGKLKTRKEKRIDPKIADLRDYALQLNNYRIGIESGRVLQAPDGKFYPKAEAPEGSKKIKIHAIRVQALVRDGGTFIAKGRGVERNVYLIEVPRVPDAQIKEYFARKRKDLMTALEQGAWVTPCNDIEKWNDRKCTDFCNVNKFCPYWIEKYSKDASGNVTEDSQEQLDEDGCPKKEGDNGDS